MNVTHFIDAKSTSIFFLGNVLILLDLLILIGKGHGRVNTDGPLWSL